MNGGRVEVDTTELQRAFRELSVELTAGGQTGARRQADATASRIRTGVPRRTGRLAATVAVVGVDGGYGVTYGGSLPYAGYIERRSQAVAHGSEGAASTFETAMRALARTVAGRL